MRIKSSVNLLLRSFIFNKYKEKPAAGSSLKRQPFSNYEGSKSGRFLAVKLSSSTSLGRSFSFRLNASGRRFLKPSIYLIEKLN